MRKKFIPEILREFRVDNNKTLPRIFFCFFYVLINDLRYGKVVELRFQDKLELLCNVRLSFSKDSEGTTEKFRI